MATPTFRFQLLSDLHLESPRSYSTYTFAATAPNLVLAGDIGNTRDAGFFTFIHTQLSRFERVFLVLGNHEPYHSSWPDAEAAVFQFAASLKHPSNSTTTSAATSTATSTATTHNTGTSAPALGEFIPLLRTRYDLPPPLNVTVLGCTLHSHIPPESSAEVGLALNDFHAVGAWTVADHNAAHAGDVAWLNAAVAATPRDRRVLVVTHHSPSTDGRVNNPMHEDSIYTSGFVTELGGEFCWRDGTPPGAFWAFGHTHYNCDEVLDRVDGAGGVRVVANQRGYSFRGGSYDFDAERVYEL
ncbi:Ser/Thr protein phosphatase superfamily [Geopyxis carbonaria]|nr:Ser/Thr protein phosphatase superfamily [Geopyxis carbonaria]